MTVADDGSVELPAEVMRQVGLGPGRSVRLVIDDHGVAITRDPDEGGNRWRGLAWMDRSEMPRAPGPPEEIPER